MKKQGVKPFDIDKLKRYIDRIKVDNGLQYITNSNHHEINTLQQILIGKMIIISEIDRIIKFIESGE